MGGPERRGRRFAMGGGPGSLTVTAKLAGVAVAFGRLEDELDLGPAVALMAEDHAGQDGLEEEDRVESQGRP